MDVPHWPVVVVGAGAAGLLAATRSAERGLKTLLVEKSAKPGVKILMSGGTRCNVTHATDRQGIADAFPRDQGRFLRSPLAALGPDDVVDLLAAEGLATKVESTGKIFPVTDRALDVQRAFVKRLDRAGAKLSLRQGVESIERLGSRFRITTSSSAIDADRVILATGGQSYPGCGTTGDGYTWARLLGHSIAPPRPALVPLKTNTPWSHALSGITLDDVSVALAPQPTPEKPGPKSIAQRRGSLLFTHVGLSGPTVLDLSRDFTAQRSNHGWRVLCDFVPTVREDQLLELFKNLPGKKQVASVPGEFLPKRVVEALFKLAAIRLDQTAAEFPKADRTRLALHLKRCSLDITGTLGMAKAEVTAGGIALDEVDSRSMASRICPGLYVVGEVLDIDGPIGGYNFQAAFSTGWLAGESV